MRLTPDDIVNYPLRQGMRGYNVAQVDELLDEIADEVERLLVENVDLRRRLERAESQVDELAETEVTLKRTLVTAQRAAEQTLEDARTRAAELVGEARREAEHARSEALKDSLIAEDELNRRRDELEREVTALQTFEQRLRRDLRTLLERNLESLDDVRGAAVPELGPPLAPPPPQPEPVEVEEEDEDAEDDVPPDGSDDEAPEVEAEVEEVIVEDVDQEAEAEVSSRRRRRRGEPSAEEDELIGGDGPAVDDHLFDEAPPRRTRRR